VGIHVVIRHQDDAGEGSGFVNPRRNSVRSCQRPNHGGLFCQWCCRITDRRGNGGGDTGKKSGQKTDDEKRRFHTSIRRSRQADAPALCVIWRLRCFGRPCSIPCQPLRIAPPDRNGPHPPRHDLPPTQLAGKLEPSFTAFLQALLGRPPHARPITQERIDLARPFGGSLGVFLQQEFVDEEVDADLDALLLDAGLGLPKHEAKAMFRNLVEKWLTRK
jgi:hypothetical protein